jgi:hypothetical protein
MVTTKKEEKDSCNEYKTKHMSGKQITLIYNIENVGIIIS